MEIVQNTWERWAPPSPTSLILIFAVLHFLWCFCQWRALEDVSQHEHQSWLRLDLSSSVAKIVSPHLDSSPSSPRFILLRWAFQAWITAGYEMLTSTSRVWIRCSKHAWYECAPGQSSVAAWTLLGSCNSKGSSLSQQQVGARADCLHNL